MYRSYEVLNIILNNEHNNFIGKRHRKFALRLHNCSSPTKTTLFTLLPQTIYKITFYIFTTKFIVSTNSLLFPYTLAQSLGQDTVGSIALELVMFRVRLNAYLSEWRGMILM